MEYSRRIPSSGTSGVGEPVSGRTCFYINKKWIPGVVDLPTFSQMPAVAHDVRALVWSGDSSDDSDSHLRGI